MTSELREIATRLRRQTSNRDILALCDAVLSSQVKVLKTPQDRRDYMREYMRKYRKGNRVDQKETVE